MTRHPMFQALEEGSDYRIAGELVNTDKVMNDSFWLGVYPGMGDEAIDYMSRTIIDFLKRYKNP
jgi:CDP-6-deoxy-D-xylo-4-hexulose-3-dehydrase